MQLCLLPPVLCASVSLRGSSLPICLKIIFSLLNRRSGAAAHFSDQNLFDKIRFLTNCLNSITSQVPPHTAKKAIPKIQIQIFPEKELHGHSPNFQIHVSVSDLYIPTIDLPVWLQERCELILGIYKLLTDTWMWKL